MAKFFIFRTKRNDLVAWDASGEGWLWEVGLSLKRPCPLIEVFEADSSCDFVINMLRIKEKLGILTKRDRKILKEGI